ncbi:hypothetical protein F5880DRAFT_1539740 [Lentinula raphanica]|nr:hypothetical protein F5880DRAFT_1539740 [Lentinula raphanica]
MRTELDGYQMAVRAFHVTSLDDCALMTMWKLALRMIIFRDGNKVDRKICVSMARGLEKNICTGYPTSKLSELALSNHLQIGLINFRDQADRRYILDHMRTRFKESGERENPWPPLDDFMRNFLSLRSYTESGMEIRTVPAKTMKMFEQHLVRGMRTKITLEEHAIGGFLRLRLGESQSVKFTADDSTPKFHDEPPKLVFSAFGLFRNETVKKEAADQIRELVEESKKKRLTSASNAVPPWFADAVSEEDLPKVVKDISPWIQVDEAINFLRRTDAGFVFFAEAPMMTRTMLQNWEKARTEAVKVYVEQKLTGIAEVQNVGNDQTASGKEGARKKKGKGRSKGRVRVKSERLD